MDKATVTPISRRADWPPEQILEEAAKRKFKSVVIVGWLEEDDENKERVWWVSSSMNSDPEVCDLLSLANHWLMQQRMGDT